ncbi:helix-turn-helix domain-containing protein [Prauserella muralis]|uniref:Uncharacterized protein n=1 Tax=Prauserella muralis TaxID=588067 RepID=A0A2V4ATF9_9PSEU|nr:helix-turn-helix domain-containing protein [Prauserella muralis]PXY24710.1 hypothetical protein BAY60_19600 [Prauserella muralis]TWE27595.1 AraC-like DNA-binding protein [Prauserella muralis]
METDQQDQWIVRRSPGRRAADEWQRALAATHVTFDIGLPAGSPFAGTVARTRLGGMDLVDCQCTPFAGRRGGDLAGEAGSERVGVQILRSGIERVRHAHAATVVHSAGSVKLWDGHQPVHLDVPEPLAKTTLVFPRERLLATCPRLADLDGLPSLDRLPGAGLIVRYVDAVVAELPTMDERMRTTAGQVALELLRSVLEPTLPDARAARREALRARARRCIRANLTNPGLTPGAVARAVAVSPRTLHAAFQDSGETVAALIRRYRLARSHEDLTDPGGGSVTEIAFRWGFSDATHFSQAFKRQYGLSPRDLRARNTRKAGAEAMA